MISSTLNHDGTELKVIPDDLDKLFRNLRILNEKSIERFGQINSLYEEYYGILIIFQKCFKILKNLQIK